MKTNKFWFVMAAAAVLTVMSVFTSCSKDDDPYLPEVIESEVLDSGLSSDVQETSGTQGTKLSYESWIVVKGQTRAAFENKVSVTLNNSLGLARNKIDVRSFDLGEEKNNISYKVGDSHKEGFVTITDSILVYTVAYEGFSFDYELVFEVPVYNDGVTNHTMPYHRYENIVSNGGYLEDMEDLNQGDTLIYQRKKLQHSIEVEFNGKNYVVVTDLILQKLIGGTADTLISAKVIDQGVEISGNEDVSVWIKIRKERLLSGIEEFTVNASLRHRIELPKKDTVSYVEYQYFPKITVNFNVLEPQEFDRNTIDNLTICDFKQTVECTWKSPDGGASFATNLYSQRAIYEDDDIKADLPYVSYENITDTGSKIGELEFLYQHDFSGVGGGIGDMYGSLLTQSFSFTFQQQTKNVTMEQVIKILKWVE